MTEFVANGLRQSAACAALVAILIGCQAAPDQTASPPPSATVRLADDGCTLEGTFSFTTARVQLHLVNETSDLFNFELLQPTAGQTHDDIVALFEQVQAALDSGQPVPAPPPWLTEIARLTLEPGQEQGLEPSPGAGSYTILCGRVRQPDELFRVMVLGPIEVTESQ